MLKRLFQQLTRFNFEVRLSHYIGQNRYFVILTVMKKFFGNSWINCTGGLPDLFYILNLASQGAFPR